MSSPSPIWNDSNLANASPAERNTKAWAIANALSSIQARIQQDNQNRVAEYNQQFAAYSQNMLNHPELTIVPPVPAIAEVVVYDSDGWPEAGPGTERVCAQKVYQTPASVHTSVGSLMQKLVDEGAASGSVSPFNKGVALYVQQVTAADGSIFVRVA